MKYNTRDFGEMEISSENIIEFVQPPFGFEDFKKYAIIKNKEIGDQIAWLQSIDEAGVCFILFDPSSLGSVFNPQIPNTVEETLGKGELICWVIGVVPEDFQKTTVNLKSPIIINTETGKGSQIILDEEYPVRYVLMQKGK